MKASRMAIRSNLTTMVAVAALIVCGAWAASAQPAEKEPLKLIKSVPLPDLHDGDFDHFTVDLEGKRLFAAAEENSKVLVFELDSGKLLQTLSDLKAPHSMVYRNDLKKLYVVDGDLGKIRMYDASGTLKNAGDIDVREGADSMAYDPATKYMYVVTGGNDAKMPNSYLTTVDTTTGKKMGDIKLDSNDVEAVALEKSGPRMFVVIRGNNTVEVFDRQKQTLLATWPLVKDANKPTAMAFDEDAHRLFIGTRNPGKLVVVDSTSGQVVASQPGASMIDDMGYDRTHKYIFFAATEFLDVFQQRDPGHYELVAHVPTAFRAKTGIFVPELNRYYLGVPHHENKSAELRIYEVAP
jgi:DNA-binding beta-propeller fold protein YncE